MDPFLLEILACPKCKCKLTYHSKRNGLLCLTDKLYFKIKEGIPILLLEESTPIFDEDLT